MPGTRARLKACMPCAAAMTKCSWAPLKELTASKAQVPMLEARSEKVLAKGKGKEKAIADPEVEEEEAPDAVHHLQIL